VSDKACRPYKMKPSAMISVGTFPPVIALTLLSGLAVEAFSFAPYLHVQKINNAHCTSFGSYSKQSCLPLQMSASSSSGEVKMPTGTQTITPAGKGFSTPLSRIVAADAQSGYVKSLGSDSVIDVIQRISESRTNEGGNGKATDASLVFDEDDPELLLGIFTERDYIAFSTKRAQAKSEEASAEYLIAPVSKYLTPRKKIQALSASSTASQAVGKMATNGLRHMVVADKVSENGRLTSSSKVLGVASMTDVMRVVQGDERLSLQALSDKYPNIQDPLLRYREQSKSAGNEAANNPETASRDTLRVGASVLAAAFVAIFFSNSPWLHDHADLAMIGIFVLGYIGIIFEEVFELNKAAISLLMSTGLWVTYADYYGGANGVASKVVLSQLGEQLSEVADICFFLLAASAIVEVVDAHQGFKVVTNLITTKSKKGLFWVIGFLTFFLSSILNNLTVTIVMVSLLRKLVPNEDDRRLFGAMVVVAANAGGVWTPIGDVTTTMLWINGQLTTIPTVTELILPSLVCLVGSLAFLVGQVEEDDSLENSTLPQPSELAARGTLVFGAGIASLLAVPVFNEFTGLPPYIAMLTGLGGMWILTDAIHLGEEDREELKLPASLAKLDISGILFFLGILMSIGVLDKSGLLKELAVFLNDNLPNQDIIATVIGLASALIDNVPLVAATMGMYDISEFGADDKLWQLIALCAGTGGSILIIGSASGVALMGLEKVDFLWYAKKVSVGAAVGYFAGIATYLAQYSILHGGGIGGLIPPAFAAGDIMQQVSGLL
jgi:Na+/H+ antiporter NhaD/arsenite permease-like protein/CBS domain-containing protein